MPISGYIPHQCFEVAQPNEAVVHSKSENTTQAILLTAQVIQHPTTDSSHTADESQER